jgi:hypothetical protein
MAPAGAALVPDVLRDLRCAAGLQSNESMKNKNGELEKSLRKQASKQA